MNRRSISDGSDRTEMAGARLELNGASKSRIIATEPEPVQYHVGSEGSSSDGSGFAGSFREPQGAASYWWIRILVVDTAMALLLQ
jgi:hypothetical protein